MLAVSVNGFALWQAGGLNSCRCCLYVLHVFLLKCGVSVNYSGGTLLVPVLTLLISHGALGMLLCLSFCHL